MAEIGKLDQRVVIQNYTTTRDASGDQLETWSTLATVWAGVRYESGSEQQESDQKVATRTIIFTIRYLAGLTEKSRIVWDSRNYDVQFIDGNQRMRYYYLRAEARNND